MALLRNHQVFTTKWQSGLVPGRNAAMPATVEVFTRTVDYVNKIPTPSESIVYTGVARIQPLRTPRRNAEVGDTKVDQTVRFQVAFTDVNFVTETMYARVLECTLNPALVNGEVYVLNESLDSSNPIERTFEAVTDTSG